MIKNKKHNLKNVSYFSIVFNGSASIEPDGYKGLTHVIEHCMCENIKKYESLYKSYALNWNAETGNNTMTFYISGLSKYINKVKKQFLDSVLNYKITKEVFERERSIILTEYIQHYSDQCAMFMSNWSRKHLNSCGPIGYIEDLKNMTYERFIEYKDKYYSNPTYIGYIHSKSSSDLKEINGLQYNNIVAYPDNIQFGSYNDYPMESYSTFDAQRILLMNTIIPYDKECLNNCYAKIFASCISGGLTSPLYQELREKLQCVYYLGSYCSKLSNTQLKFYTLVFCDGNKADIVMKRFKEVISDIKNYLNESDFNAALNCIKNNIKLDSITSYTNTNMFVEEYDKIYENFTSDKLTYNGFLKFVDTFLKSNIEFYKDSDYIK